MKIVQIRCNLEGNLETKRGRRSFLRSFQFILVFIWSKHRSYGNTGDEGDPSSPLPLRDLAVRGRAQPGMQASDRPPRQTRAWDDHLAAVQLPSPKMRPAPQQPLLAGGDAVASAKAATESREPGAGLPAAPSAVRHAMGVIALSTALRRAEGDYSMGRKEFQAAVQQKKIPTELRGHTRLLTLLTCCPTGGMSPHCGTLECLPGGSCWLQRSPSSWCSTQLPAPQALPRRL